MYVAPLFSWFQYADWTTFLFLLSTVKPLVLELVWSQRQMLWDNRTQNFECCCTNTLTQRYIPSLLHVLFF